MGGIKLEDTKLSYASVQRSRVDSSAYIAEYLKERWICPDRLLVHFDGKLMSSLTCKWEKEEQMAILVSGKYIENHFDITKLKYSACLLIDTPQRY